MNGFLPQRVKCKRMQKEEEEGRRSRVVGGTPYFSVSTSSSRSNGGSMLRIYVFLLPLALCAYLLRIMLRST